MAAILSTQKVYKAFGGVVALDEASIEVDSRSVTMIIGPNGSGKSTLINVISGYYKPDRGEVLFNGSNITSWPPHKVYKAGIVRTFQIPSLFHKLTVLENLLVSARDHPGESPLNALFKVRWVKKEEEIVRKAFELLELLNLSHLWDQPVGKLSGGQMKLVEIGRALMSEPKIILLDEPIAGINPRLAHEIFEHILELRRDLNTTFLVVEHRLDVALQYVDKVYAMRRGRVIVEGKPGDVVSDHRVIESYLGG